MSTVANILLGLLVLVSLLLIVALVSGTVMLIAWASTLDTKHNGILRAGAMSAGIMLVIIEFIGACVLGALVAAD